MLNGLNGTHAGGIIVQLKNVNSNELLFQTLIDDGGRLNKELSNDLADKLDTYELIFKIGDFWKQIINQENVEGILDEIVIRFKIPYKDKKYHFPIILSPNSYSTWWSEGE
jgi:5-hydroxyisourate hydrolase